MYFTVNLVKSAVIVALPPEIGRRESVVGKCSGSGLEMRDGVLEANHADNRKFGQTNGNPFEYCTI